MFLIILLCACIHILLYTETAPTLHFLATYLIVFMTEHRPHPFSRNNVLASTPSRPKKQFSKHNCSHRRRDTPARTFPFPRTLTPTYAPPHYTRTPLWVRCRRMFSVVFDGALAICLRCLMYPNFTHLRVGERKDDRRSNRLACWILQLIFISV